MNLNATLFAQFVVFFILAGFTMKFVWPPLMKALDERAERIANGLAAADRGKADLAAAEKRVQAELASARDAGQQRIADAEKRAAMIIDEAKKQAADEAARIVATAKAEAEQQVTRAREELRGQVATLAVKGAEQILKREVNAAAHADLLSQLSVELWIMAELATVARPYAEALFRVAKQGDLNAWSDLVSELTQVGSHPDVQAFATNPNVTTADVLAVLTSAVKAPVTQEANNFLTMLIENGRVSLLPEIGAQFQMLKNADAGAADAGIYSAFDLSTEQVAQLLGTLEKKFGRKLNPTVTVDPSLIGGVRVVVGDEVLDTSVRAKLQQMHVALAS